MKVIARLRFSGLTFDHQSIEQGLRETCVRSRPAQLIDAFDAVIQRNSELLVTTEVMTTPVSHDYYGCGTLFK